MANKSLDIDQQISIQALIRAWEGKLTWELLVTKIESSLEITTTRQTLDKYLNIKGEYKRKKLLLKGRPICSDNTSPLSLTKQDIDLKEKLVQTKAELDIARDEVGYLQAFIQKIVNIAQSDPNLMEVLQKTMADIESKK